MKEKIGEVLAQRLQNGQVVGAGSGQTAEYVMGVMGKRVKAEKLSVACVTTSMKTAERAIEAGFVVLDPFVVDTISWAFDGADEVDPKGRLIKGNSAAMFREKIISKRAGGMTVVVTEEKLVEKLGSNFAIPVEAFPLAAKDVHRELLALGATEVTLREGGIGRGKSGPVITFNGNCVFDVRFKEISDDLERELKCITGVIDTGLFFGQTKDVLVGYSDRLERRVLKDGKLTAAPIA